MAQFLGLDLIFTSREICQSVTTDPKTGTKVLVNSNKVGTLLAVKPVPSHVALKPWFTRKFRYPREYLGIPKIQQRVEKLSYLVHILVQTGIPSLSALKSLRRLSLIWYHAKYKDMRKHIHSLTQEALRSSGLTRSPWMPKTGLSLFPVLTGDKIHESGIKVPLWNRPRL